MADRHSGVLIGVAGVVVVAGAALISVAAAEVSNTARSLSSNGWFDLGLALVILGVALAAMGGVLHFRREVEGSPAPGVVDTPRAAALPAATGQPAGSAVNPDEFKPYHAESGEFPDGKALTFGFDHINDHPGAYMALNPRRCTVITPSGVTVSATRPNRYFQYPYEFDNAPPVRPGLYRFRLDGQLANGEWAFITKGEYEVKAPPPLIVTIVDSRFENWKRIALIVALRVKVTNTTGKMIRLSSVGFTYDTEGKPALHATLSGGENLELDRELVARRDRQHYGIPLNGHATVPSGESVTGWVVSGVTRPDGGGTPSCTVAVKDELGNEYLATRPKEEAKTYS